MTPRDSEMVAELVHHGGYAVMVRELTAEFQALETALESASGGMEAESAMLHRWQQYRRILRKVTEMPRREGEKFRDALDADPLAVLRPRSTGGSAQ